jgi:hypothetical protein
VPATELPGVKENHSHQITRCKEKHRYHEPGARKSIVNNNPVPLLVLLAFGSKSNDGIQADQ